MKRLLFPLVGALLTCLGLACSGCSTRAVTPAPEPVKPTAVQLAAAAKVGVGAEELTELLAKPVFRMKPPEVGHYLAYLHELEPDLRARVAHLARKNIGQPYELYLLGEFPYETADAQPLYNLEKSDCVVFAEHTYAMALSQSWEEFFWMLQRIRYKDGVIGVATRNHYTETDWDRNNAWLVTDVSGELAGDRAGSYTMTIDRQKFLKNRYHLDRNIPVEASPQQFVPKDVVSQIESQLREGDYVNVISTKNGDYWASHVGLVVVGPNGERHFLHSSEPAVREETFASYIRRAAEREARHQREGKVDKVLAGFKFLRLADAPEVPPMAPQPRPSPSPPPAPTPPPPVAAAAPAAAE